MNKCHYKGLFTVPTGDLIAAIYNPHLFTQEAAQIAYRLLTPIPEHKSREIENIAYSYMGAVVPKGEYVGRISLKLTVEGNIRASIVGNSQFWNVCELIKKNLTSTSQI